MPDFDKLEVPNCAGLIQINRVSGTSAALYGSEFMHQHYMMLNIYTDKPFLSMGDVQHAQDKLLVRLYLSQTQFAELITNLNNGSGVPCTLDWVMGETFDSPEAEDYKKHYDAEGQSYIQESLEAAKNALKALDEVKLSKKDKERLADELNTTIRRLENGVPFMTKQFSEHLTKMQTRAKMELAAYIDRVKPQIVDIPKLVLEANNE